VRAARSIRSPNGPRRRFFLSELAAAYVRILHLITDLAGGGAERQLSYLAPALAARGHDVHLGYFRRGEFPPSMPGVTLQRFDSQSGYDPRLFWEVARLTDRLRPDLVHTWILQMDIIGGVAAALKGVPWVLREPSSAMAYRPETWKNWLRVQVAKRADAIICNSRGGDDYWQRRLPASRRYIVPNGLPLAEIGAVEPNVPEEVRKRNAPIVLYVGRLSSDVSATKNLKELLHALALVKKETDVAGVLCGEGPEKAELLSLRERLGLDGDVIFTGQLPPSAVLALMKSAAVFVSLSAYEGSPNSVMEAMACRCPVVLSDMAAHREIADETCAVFVDPHDRQQTAASILRVLRDREASRSRALAAETRAQAWSTTLMVQGYERIYEEVR
jgi:glycosyltransferase involved in cell wall biosynthesis